MADIMRKSYNLCNFNTFANGYYLDLTTGLPKEYGSSPNRIATLTPINVDTISNVIVNYNSSLTGDTKFIYSLFNNNTLIRRVAENMIGTVIDVSAGNRLYLSLYNLANTVYTTSISSLIVNIGSTALPYKPYYAHSLKKFDGVAWQDATVHEF